MHGDIFKNVENTSSEEKQFVLQNDYALLVNLNGSIHAIQGSMVAYKGDIDFSHQGAGVSRFAKSVATGESLPLMKISGNGDVYLARYAQQVHVIDLVDDEFTITSKNVLAFTEGVEWDISIIRAGVMGFAAGGLFNTTLKGTGTIAITTSGTPIVIPVDGTTVFSDVNSIVAWSTGLKTSMHRSFKAKSLIGLGSGEAFQMKFSGSGYIIVQPS
jgi:uncharacterized protein (AIM24 family)